MSCLLTLTIIVLGDSYTVNRAYSGKLLAIEANSYRVDFSHRQPWLTKPLSVPKAACEKED